MMISTHGNCNHGGLFSNPTYESLKHDETREISTAILNDSTGKHAEN